MTKSEEIHVLGERVRLLQAPQGFRTAVDSVLLAAACPAKAGDRVLDMGCGVGSVGLCVLSRVEGAFLTGVEIQDDCVDLAGKNAGLNGFQDRCRFMCSDIRHFEVNAPDDRFDHVVCNPPFFEAGHYIPSPEEGRDTARGHDKTDMELKDWLKAGLGLLKSGGSLTIIHRADATDRILRYMAKSFGAIDILPLWPKAGRDPKRVIIRGIKDRQSPCHFHYGVTLHDENGEYTDEAEQILRHAAPLL